MPDLNRACLAARLAALSGFLLAPGLQAADDRAPHSRPRLSPVQTSRPQRRWPPAADLPAHCRVQGTIPEAIRFELRLPLAGWNGKFYMAGCGGFCGSLDADRPGVVNALNHGLRRGYASATSDSGHSGTSVTDGRWALDNPGAEADWGWRSVTETARVSRDLVRAFYGRPAARSYFAGCSTGGRMGLMAAQRFPHDFDGIIAGAPALDYTGLVATQLAWIVQANTAADGSEILDRAKVPLIAKAVLETCDGIDGQRDGLIDDPRRCDWKPAQLQCKGAAAADCLTAKEIGVLDHWYMPVTGGDGRIQYPGGVPKGSEPYWPVWLSGIPGSNAPALAERFGTDFLRYMAFVPDAGDEFRPAQVRFRPGSAAPGNDGAHLRRDEPGPDCLPRARRQAAAVPWLGRPARHAAAHARLLRCSARNDGRRGVDCAVRATLHAAGDRPLRHPARPWSEVGRLRSAARARSVGRAQRSADDPRTCAGR